MDFLLVKRMSVSVVYTSLFCLTGFSVWREPAPLSIHSLLWAYPDTCMIGDSCAIRVYLPGEGGPHPSAISWRFSPEFEHLKDSGLIHLLDTGCVDSVRYIVCRALFVGLDSLFIPLSSFSLAMDATSRLFFPDDTSQSIVISLVPVERSRAIAPPHRMYDPPLPLWAYYLGAILFVLIVLLTVVYLIYRFVPWKKVARLLPFFRKYAVSPIEIFREEIKEARSLVIYQKDIKNGVDRASDALRRLLETLTDIPALKLTTIQLTVQLRKAGDPVVQATLPPSVQATLRSLLEWADRIKFAGHSEKPSAIIPKIDEIERLGIAIYETYMKAKSEKVPHRNDTKQKEGNKKEKE